MSGVNPRVIPMAAIFKLNVDCFEDWFDWLSLKDLKALRLTCKRMKQVVDYYIRINYPVGLLSVLMDDNQIKEIRCTKTPFELTSHMKLSVRKMTLSQAQIKGIKYTLGQVESIELNCVFPKRDFYEHFLKHCTRLKHLMIQNFDTTPFIGTGIEWANRHYPTLEHIGIYEDYSVRAGTKFTELKTFFEKNPNVRSFSASFKTIWQNRDWMLESNIRLDRLDIWNSLGSSVNFSQVCGLLNRLHERGFYQRLHVYNADECDHEDHIQIIAVRGIERLALLSPFLDCSTLPPFTNLEELLFRRCPDIERSKVLANNLANVRRISIGFADINNILPFIQHCPKLRQIKIRRLRIENHFDSRNIIDLLALNRERQKLPDACKITIFVSEKVFLENKWNQRINWSMIELKHSRSWEQSNAFFENFD